MNYKLWTTNHYKKVQGMPITDIEWKTTPSDVKSNASINSWNMTETSDSGHDTQALENPDQFDWQYQNVYRYDLIGFFPGATKVSVFIDGEEHQSTEPSSDGFAELTGDLV